MLKTKLRVLDMKNVFWFLFGLLILLNHVFVAFKELKFA